METNSSFNIPFVGIIKEIFLTNITDTVLGGGRIKGGGIHDYNRAGPDWQGNSYFKK